VYSGRLLNIYVAYSLMKNNKYLFIVRNSLCRGIVSLSVFLTPHYRATLYSECSPQLADGAQTLLNNCTNKDKL